MIDVREAMLSEVVVLQFRCAKAHSKYIFKVLPDCTAIGNKQDKLFWNVVEAAAV